MTSLHIELIPALSDNYIYLLRDAGTGTVAVVDPAAAEPVEAALARHGWRLDLILNTHHHGDHVGGNADLKRRFGCPIVGPKAEAVRIPGLDRGVVEGDRVDVGGFAFEVLEVPGHTAGHIAFWCAEADALFCGDALFSLGCGRMFEGTAPQMWASLDKLRRLPDTAHIHCGHEYTQSNARFALSLDPSNLQLQARAAEVDVLRAAGRPTIPASLGWEKAVNPFLRCDDPGIQAAVGLSNADPAVVFAEVRRRKDSF
ncbi:MAG TPA: hydroxyacylglutathione hydrolase [Azospirillaceae bacterium]|nr:hydroxyacylglutathione hydrolase [Azospirillaceae bacterium]